MAAGSLPSGTVTIVLREATSQDLDVSVDDSLQFADLRLDGRRWRVQVRGTALAVTRLEFVLLKGLISENARTKSYEWLSETVWKEPYLGDSSHIRAAAKRLRRKLEAVHSDATVYCIRGVGFCLVDRTRSGVDLEAAWNYS